MLIGLATVRVIGSAVAGPCRPAVHQPGLERRGQILAVIGVLRVRSIIADIDRREESRVEKRHGQPVIGLALLPGVVAFERQERIGIPPVGERGIEIFVLLVVIVAERTLILIAHDEPVDPALLRINRAGGVQRDGVAGGIPKAAGLALIGRDKGRERGAPGGLRALGDDVDHATGIVLPVKHGGRPLEHLHAVDIDGRRRGKTRSRPRQSVDLDALDVGTGGGETAQGELIDGRPLFVQADDITEGILQA